MKLSLPDIQALASKADDAIVALIPRGVKFFVILVSEDTEDQSVNVGLASSLPKEDAAGLLESLSDQIRAGLPRQVPQRAERPS